MREEGEVLGQSLRARKLCMRALTYFFPSNLRRQVTSQRAADSQPDSTCFTDGWPVSFVRTSTPSREVIGRRVFAVVAWRGTLGA